MVLRSARRHFVPVLACLLLVSLNAAPQKLLTVDRIYGDEGWTRFNGSAAATMSWAVAQGPWLNDTEYVWPGNDDAGSPWMRVDAVTGTREPLFTTSQLETALLKAGVPVNRARGAARGRHSNFNSARDALLLTIEDDLYHYDIPARTATRLTSSPGAKSEATFSPDGRTIAFVNNNNLHVTAIAPPAERALTTDGDAELLNGKLDWVYSEELYGRGTYRGYWWSPDSSHIAFLQLDEKLVPEYALVDDIPHHPDVRRWHYPKAGDPNPTARLGIVAAAGGSARWVDTSKYADFLVVNVGWAPDSSAVIYQIQDREQRWLDLNRMELGSGRTSTLVKETSKAWVERWQDSSADPVWLKDGSFLWLSERSGWRHIYHYGSAGALRRQVTTGDWEVRRVHGLDSAESTIFFDATAHSPVGVDLYRVRVDGTGLQRISTRDGRHSSFLNPSRSLFLQSWSDVNTPPQVRLHRVDTGFMTRLVDANRTAGVDEYVLLKPEFLQVRARDGFVMEAMMIKPPDFNPSRRYPVYQFTYGGPHAQQVVNRWGGTDFVYHQLLAQRGIIVWVLDNRTASSKGVQSAWPLYGEFGRHELRDIEDGIRWLKRQSYVDAERIGISGISYGGFLTLYAMTHSRDFAMGIAEGAVTDWRNYDSIYTERYMGLPKANPDGYRRSSPRFHAANLSGELLLIHSALDDNVHPQNATQFAYELQKAGRLFQLMIYPKSAHGVSDPPLAAHLRQMMLDFTLKNLLR
jgi:dipeptidyl-peptidase-4